MKTTCHGISRLCVFFCALLWFLSWCATTTSAANDAAVLAGYQQFYSGDKSGARDYFERLLKDRRGDLSLRLGLLQVIEDLSRATKALEPQFERDIEALLDDAEARHGRAATDDEALFTLANGYLLRARYRFDHDKGMWGAARDGAKSKKYADAYLKRHPEHGDAYFALGTYNYYVDIAPSFVRVLRLFLFLPGGSRVEGLKQMEKAYREGSLFKYQAGMVLMEVYGTFEARPADGIAVGRQLTQLYPDNPQVQFDLAQLYLSPAVEDYRGAEAQYESMIAREDKRSDERQAKYQARQGLASARFQQWRVDDAIKGLTATVDARPEKFAWVMPNFLLRRGNYRALLNDPSAAEDARRVLAEPKWKDWHKGAADQIAWIDRRRASGEAAIYAALIPGNRATAEGKWDEASAIYERVRQQHPGSPDVRYRIARLSFARGEMQRAAAEFGAIAAERNAPSTLKGQALLYQARANDVAGRREEAKKLYERVVSDHEKEGVAWAAKVGLVSPYRRR
jgi:tetratricopeptide (TPR) repeat protein